MRKVMIIVKEEAQGTLDTEIVASGFSAMELVGLLEDIKYDVLTQNKRKDIAPTSNDQAESRIKELLKDEKDSAPAE